MNSLIWLELGNTRLHKGVQSIKWKSATYWHCMIRAFHPFCATYPFGVRTVYILSWNGDPHAESRYQCTVSAAIYWPKKMLLKLMVASFRGFASNNQSEGELSLMCVLHGVKVEQLTLSCRWWDCTAGYAEWSHPAACPSWCRNLQTCQSAGGNGREKHSRQRSTNRLGALSENVAVHVINLLPTPSSSTDVPGSFQTWGSPAWILAILTQ